MYLCEVSTMAASFDCLSASSMSQSARRAAGSTPAVGSSSSSTAGWPVNYLQVVENVWIQRKQSSHR